MLGNPPSFRPDDWATGECCMASEQCHAMWKKKPTPKSVEDCHAHVCCMIELASSCKDPGPLDNLAIEAYGFCSNPPKQ